MFRSSSLISLVLVSFTLIHTGITADEPLYSICFSAQNFTAADSPYSNNINNVLSLLASQVPPTGFGKGYKTQNQIATYGLGLCRGDVSTPDCKECVVGAGKELRLRCPYSKGAIIWYDNCLIKYSDEQFFGVIDGKNKFALLNVQDVDMDFKAFYNKTKELLDELTNKAYQDTKRYASGELKIANKGYDRIFGLAQCTRDLTAASCKECLEDAIAGVPGCCYGKKGGRVVGGSCNVRYELYPFVNV